MPKTITPLGAGCSVHRNFSILNGKDNSRGQPFLQKAPHCAFMTQRLNISLAAVGEYISKKLGFHKRSDAVRLKSEFIQRCKTFTSFIFQAYNFYGEMLYEKAVEEVDFPLFVTKFNMPNTFLSWFIVTEMHVYMLLVRAMAEEEQAKVLRNSIVRQMYVDVGQRGKMLSGASSKAVRRQLQELYEQFNYNMLAYSEGMVDDKVLASAIWARFFGGKSDKYDDIELLVKYMRENVRSSLPIRRERI